MHIRALDYCDSSTAFDTRTLKDAAVRANLRLKHGELDELRLITKSILPHATV
jgi:hypothetical protein